MKHFWKHQRDIYGLFLKKSKKDEDRELYENIDSYDKTLCENMLRLYIERCKMKHALAFFQYRAREMPHEEEECRELFDARAAYLRK